MYDKLLKPRQSFLITLYCSQNGNVRHVSESHVCCFEAHVRTVRYGSDSFRRVGCYYEARERTWQVSGCLPVLTPACFCSLPQNQYSVGPTLYHFA